MEHKITYGENVYLGERVTHTSSFDVALNRGEFFRFDRLHCRVKVQCMRGVFWVTQPGNHEDYLLAAGESYITTQRGSVLAQALKDGHIHVSLLDGTGRLTDQ